MSNYTEEQFEAFCDLVLCSRSPWQYEREEAAKEVNEMTNKVGIDVAEEMLERFHKEESIGQYK